MAKGTGTLYQRGNVWWLQYYNRGRKIRESSFSTNEQDARRLLNKRLGEIADGKAPTFYFDKVKFDELLEDLKTDYRINGRRSAERLTYSLAHIEEELKGYKVPQITTARISKYIEKRLEQGASNGTVNRELSAIRRALNLGKKSGKVANVPHVPMLKEANARQGFFDQEHIDALIEELPDYLKAPVTFAYYTGMRKGEVFGLTWDRVNVREGFVRLEGTDTKNAEARTIFLSGEALDAIKIAQSRRVIGLPLVFHKDGQPIKQFRATWSGACEKAGCPDMLFHDLRRSAVRNMVRAGVPERVAMQISGHKTRSVFERYNIVSDNDLREAALKIDAHAQRSRTQTGTITGTVTPLDKKEARGKAL